MKRFLLITALTLLSTAAYAQQPVQFTPDRIYFGAGASQNDYSDFSDSATGYQFFAGWDIIRLNNFQIGAEVGYMDAGETKDKVTTCYFGYCVTATAKEKATGFWATGVASYALTPTVDLIGRAGLDFGDDDGAMAGVGVGFNLAPHFKLRGEYVVRQHIDSLQLNLIYHL